MINNFFFLSRFFIEIVVTCDLLTPLTVLGSIRDAHLATISNNVISYQLMANSP
jgi:hypothetical protein